MRINNLEQFPLPVQNALKNDSYDGGIGTDISATSLKDSARIPYLKRNNPDHVREDARNMILPLFGTAIHLIMENNSPKDWITEERYYAVVNTPEGEKVLSGQIDAVVPVDPKKAEKFFGKPVPKPCLIYDYKVLHSWKAESDMSDFEEQGNIYAYLLRQNGFTPISFTIWGFVRDWTNALAERKQINALHKKEFKLWPEKKCEDYISERALLHFSEGEPECSEKDMWLSPSKWEAKKKGHVKATKLFDTEREAQLWIADGDHRSTAGTTIDDWNVTERPRVRRRCEGNYCGVAEICSQFEIYRRENENRTEGKQ